MGTMGAPGSACSDNGRVSSGHRDGTGRRAFLPASFRSGRDAVIHSARSALVSTDKCHQGRSRREFYTTQLTLLHFFSLRVFASLFYACKGKIFVKAHSNSFLRYFLRLQKERLWMICVAQIPLSYFLANSQKWTS